MSTESINYSALGGLDLQHMFSQHRADPIAQ